MIIKKDYTGKDKSIFKCDRCEKEIIEDERFKVSIQKSLKCKYKTLKSWDLCKKCYSALYRGIEKGVTK